MKDLILFSAVVYKKCKENDLLEYSASLAFKIIRGFFPFLIFLMSIIGFLDLNVDRYFYYVIKNVPNEISSVIEVFYNEIVCKKSFSILSSSLIFVLYTSSSAFDAAIKSINQAYEFNAEQNFIKRRIISLLLVFAFVVLIILSLIVFIFGDYIKEFLMLKNYFNFIPRQIFDLTGNLVLLVILIIFVAMMYKISIYVKIPVKNLLPGTIITVAFWFLFSKGFNIYVNNFSKYSAVYGSVASIFVLLIWINFICFFLLLGGQINAILYRWKKFNKQ